MKIEVIGSTCTGYQIPKNEAMLFSGRAAGICYMPDNYQTLTSEETEKTLKRANGTLLSGHHSVYDHVKVNLLLEEVPKFLAMVLNNEGVYDTSEKSARYTKMKPTEDEMKLYSKWQDVFCRVIQEKYFQKFSQGMKTEKAVQTAITKLAQENARYMISVFTPTTLMYTVSLRQLNYLLSFFEDFIQNENETAFYAKVKEAMMSFVKAVPDELKIEGLNAREKERTISIFDERQNRKEIFSEVYCTTYEGSFAEYAQAQRHRTLEYKMRLLDEPKFYVPEILKEDEALVKEWLEDISSVAEFYPQGMLISIRERGTYEKFILKCKERLCGAAQLEIALQTKQTLNKYLQAVHNEEEDDIYCYLLKYSHGARCTFPNFQCNKRCVWGAKEALTRKI